MTKYTAAQIIQMVRAGDVEFIRMQFTDIFGRLKNVAITASQIEKALNNQIMIDGSSIEGFARIHESDQYLHPDPNSFAILPWRPQQGKVARLICDVCNPDGTPFAGDPRNVLKRALQRATDMGYSFKVGPECEFFLFQTDEAGNPSTKLSDEAGYFDLSPLDHGENTRREILQATVLNLCGLSPDGRLVEAVELSNEHFYLAYSSIQNLKVAPIVPIPCSWASFKPEMLLMRRQASFQFCHEA